MYILKPLKKIIVPSPAVFVVKKVSKNILFRGGGERSNHQSSQEFTEFIDEVYEPKPPRLSNIRLNELLKNKSKRRLTKNERLLKSVVEKAEMSRILSDKDFKNLEEMYEFLQKYKTYLRLKRFIPISIVAPFTTGELSKMAYATAISSKSVALTLQGVIGYSLPAFFFFHMSYFYAPDRLKPICQAGKYTFGACFMVINYVVDELTEDIETRIFKEPVPIDINKTGGTIPGDIGSLSDVRELLSDLKKTTEDFKTY